MKKLFLLLCLPITLIANQCVTVEALQAEFKDAPHMSVGFDVDETVLFASPVFHYVSTKQCGGEVATCMARQAFWEEANQLDAFSLPKSKGLAMVQFHLNRGDDVYFITARTPSSKESLTQTLAQLTDYPKLNPVIFTGYSTKENLKIKPIQSRDIKVFYGDSDTDIEAAIAANARPIRMLRNPATLETHNVPRIGQYDEAVVCESEV